MNTFGDDIKDFIDLEAEAKAARALLPPEPTKPVAPIQPKIKGTAQDFSVHPKSPKSRKVKFGNLSKYVITELATLDNDWTELSWEITAQESLENGSDIMCEDFESQMIEIEGKVSALIQLGRYFGIAMDNMLHYIPSINENYISRMSALKENSEEKVA